ncbi:MAG: proton-conducting transporter membrane subunit, partial [Bradymonadaceae bacterium]
MSVGGLEFTVGLWLDGLSWWIAVLVALICLLVTAWAAPYMEGQRDLPRFYALMTFFAASMLTLVLASSFLSLFVAWEAVGLASWGLIGFWYDRHEARCAARRAFLMTRLGDVGFLIGWLTALHATGTTRIDMFLQTVETGTLDAGTLTIVALLIFAAAIGKSAQLPLTAWLPDAMVGPTPVSALLHSATMV